MSPEQFQQIDALFLAAADLPPTQRTAFLATVDPALRPAVEALLAHDAGAEAQLDAVLQSAVDELETPSDIGLRVGPYLLIRELGHGGMGTVYQAVRSDGEYLQTVAVKLVRRGMDSAAILQRFRTERQILAALTHPNIAALLDGGTAPDGRPYLVMEYIDGDTLLRYAVARGLDTAARLQLFLPVCRAVHYAHRQQVLHRDLKPGNIMVNAEGIPKLLDFGIAKLLLNELVPGGAPVTETEVRLLTPDYASPEQLAGLELSPATDIYSLGVLLHELLTGERPAPTGSTNPQLPRDIANIIAYALRPEPSRRYPSAEAFAEDLERFLAGAPIHARRENLYYRTLRTLRRHWLPAMAAFGLAIGVATTAFNLSQQGPPAAAVAACLRGEQLLRVDLRATEAGPGLPRSLRESIESFEAATAADPTYERAWAGLAEAAEYALDFDQSEAEALTAKATLATQRAIALNPRSATALAVDGRLHFRAWRLAAAAEGLGRAVEADPAQAFVVSEYGQVLVLLGRYAEAITALERTIAIHNQAGSSSIGVGIRPQLPPLTQLSNVLIHSGRIAEAIDRADYAVSLQANNGPTRTAAGRAYEAAGDLVRAEKEYRTAMMMSPGDSRLPAELGFLYARQNRRPEALRMLRELETFQAAGRPVHTLIARLHFALGDTADALRHVDEAERRRESILLAMLVDPRMSRWLSEPRLQELAARLGIVRPQ